VPAACHHPTAIRFQDAVVVSLQAVIKPYEFATTNRRTNKSAAVTGIFVRRTIEPDSYPVHKSGSHI